MKKYLNWSVLTVLAMTLCVSFVSCDDDDDDGGNGGFNVNLMIDGKKAPVNDVVADYTPYDTDLHLVFYWGDIMKETLSFVSMRCFGFDIDKIQVGDDLCKDAYGYVDLTLAEEQDYGYYGQLDYDGGKVILKNKNVAKKELTVEFQNVIVKRLYNGTKEVTITGTATVIYDQINPVN